jgi:hypothetical protein
MGTQSFVNKKIFFPNWIKRHLIRSKVKNSTLSSNIKKIMNQNLQEKQNLKNKMKNLFKNNYELTKEKDIYQIFLKKICNQHKNSHLFSNLSVLASNLLNSVLVPFLIVFSVIFNDSSFAAEIGIYPGIILLLTQVFSANARSLLLYNRDRSFYDQAISLRFYLGLLIVFILTIYQFHFYYNENFTTLFILSFIVYISWINEINLAIHEKNRSSFFIKFFLIISIIFYFLIIADYLLKDENLLKILKIYLCFHILFFLYHINFLNFNIKKSTKYFQNQFKEYLSFASSFFNIIAVIIWRISLVLLLGKSTAGLFFASFAIASFPGTVFNNIVAQIVIINKRIKDFVSKSSNLLLIFYIIFILSLITLNQIFFKNNEFYNFFNITLISLIGTPFMLRALYFRHMFLSVSRSYQKKIFIRDIMYGVSISPIIVALYYIGGQDSLIYSYLISSFLALIYYQRVK